MKSRAEGEAPENLDDLAGSMGALLAGVESGGSAWREDEFGELFEHQLAAGLREDLGLFFDNVEGALAGSGVITFGDLLGAEQPPVSLLRMVRQFAKKLAGQPSQYPGDVALALYYAAIAAAQARAGASISSMSRAELQRGYAWAGRLAWMPERLRPLFEEASA
jgi:hypothetical protein